MAKLKDLLDSVGYGDDGITPLYPENFITDLSAAYDEDMAAPTSKIEVMTAELAEAKEKITALQAHNYELLMQIPSNDSSDDSDDSDDTDDEPKGVDSLFKEEE